MNNEDTRLLNEDPRFIDSNNAQSVKSSVDPKMTGWPKGTEQTQPKQKKGKSFNTAAAAAGGFIAGAAVGATTSAYASSDDEETATEAVVTDPNAETEDAQEAENTTMEAETSSVAENEENNVQTVAEEKTEVPKPEQAILANDEGIRYAHVNADNFNDAFAQARSQVGAGGVFEYNGKLYGTYYADEWIEMSAQERADYQTRVNEIAPSHHSTPSHTGYSQDMAMSHDNSPEIIPTNATMISAEPVDNEIRILGVEAVENGKGNIMNVALIDAGGNQALMVDINNDGTIDVLVHDDNYDLEIQPSEIHDISEAGIQVEDLLETQAMQNGDPLYTAYDDTPDYFNDADSVMNV